MLIWLVDSKQKVRDPLSQRDCFSCVTLCGRICWCVVGERNFQFLQEWRTFLQRASSYFQQQIITRCKPKYTAGDEWAVIEAKTNKAKLMNKFML